MRIAIALLLLAGSLLLGGCETTHSQTRDDGADAATMRRESPTPQTSRDAPEQPPVEASAPSSDCST